MDKLKKQEKRAEILPVEIERVVIEQAARLIQKHYDYVESFKKEHKAFSVSYRKGKKEYTFSGWLHEIANHREKTAEKILRLAL